ncbi:MAG TPA: hypothetical protein GXZ78_07610 [Eubacteriaceae bacterium]|nr:hypothetical protein [Eubacteriaceae bacterium]
MALEEPKDDDLIETSGDINFIFSQDMVENFTAINIDYGSSFFRKGFTITSNRSGGFC